MSARHLITWCTVKNHALSVMAHYLDWVEPLLGVRVGVRVMDDVECHFSEEMMNVFGYCLTGRARCS